MSLIHYHPWNLRRIARTGAPLEAGWAPAVDIAETDEAFVLTADLPGVAKDAIEITMEDGVLTISGERSSVSEEKTAELYRSERHYGKFSRRFTLPESADVDRISAASDNGVLTVTIPKKAELAPRRITVNAA